MMAESPTPDELRVFMDPYFTGLVIEGFGQGIYTLLFFQVIWRLHKKCNRGFYFFALILLWILSMINFAVECNLGRTAFVFSNSSPADISKRLSLGQNSFMMNSFMYCYIPFIAAMLVSDAILIWRCHTLWRNRYILITLLLFLTATSGLMLGGAFLMGDHSSFLIGSLGVLSSFITTVSTTSLIALKILLVTRQNRMRYSYTKIIEILVESATIVSIVALGITIMELVVYIHPYNLRTASGSGRLSYQVLQYLSVLETPVTVISPTLTAFRVTTQPSQTEVDPPRKSTVLPRFICFRRNHHGSNANSQALTHQCISSIREPVEIMQVSPLVTRDLSGI